MNDEFKNDEMSDEYEATTLQKIKDWTQENLRIIISVLVVFLIASSIYSYSKRGEEATTVTDSNTDVEKILDKLSSSENNKEADITDKSASDETETTTADSEEKSKNTEDTTSANNDTEKDSETTPTEQTTKAVSSQDSQETENSFIESASQGDGLTVLARKSLAHYLEKNPDSALTPEHKIYIEDYLRKNVNFHGQINVGTSVEFSKNLIKNAIDASKNLNDTQLKNLHKYAINVQF